MKTIIISILYVHYRIFQLGRAGKLYSAGSASYMFPGFFIIALHLTIGEVFGVSYLIKINAFIIGSILFIIFIILNLLIFVRNKNYLIIEEFYSHNNKARKRAIFIFSLYMIWVIGMFVIVEN